MLIKQYCRYKVMLIVLFCFTSRYADQPFANHGEAGFGPLRVVQSSHRSWRPGGGDQQETLARSHQRIGTAILNHISCIHPQNTVSCILLIHLNETYSFMHQ